MEGFIGGERIVGTVLERREEAATIDNLFVIYRDGWRRSQKFYCHQGSNRCSLRHACEYMICSIHPSFVLRNDI